MTYDNNLLQHQQKVALKKQLEAKLNDLREQQHKVAAGQTAYRLKLNKK